MNISNLSLPKSTRKELRDNGIFSIEAIIARKSFVREHIDKEVVSRVEKVVLNSRTDLAKCIYIPVYNIFLKFNYSNGYIYGHISHPDRALGYEIQNEFKFNTDNEYENTIQYLTELLFDLNIPVNIGYNVLY